MDKKSQEVERVRIRARIKELGYTERGLSMRLFNKPDRIRNFLAGKSNNWLADTHKTVVDFLWPEGNKMLDERSVDQEKFEGLLCGLEMILGAFIAKKVITKQDLEGPLNYQLRELRKRNRPFSAEVLDQLLDFLHSESFETQSGAFQQSPQPHSDQSKTA